MIKELFRTRGFKGYLTNSNFIWLKYWVLICPNMKKMSVYLLLVVDLDVWKILKAGLRASFPCRGRIKWLQIVPLWLGAGKCHGNQNTISFQNSTTLVLPSQCHSFLSFTTFTIYIYLIFSKRCSNLVLNWKCREMW